MHLLDKVLSEFQEVLPQLAAQYLQEVFAGLVLLGGKPVFASLAVSPSVHEILVQPSRLLSWKSLLNVPFAAMTKKQLCDTCVKVQHYAALSNLPDAAWMMPLSMPSAWRMLYKCPLPKGSCIAL